jgi:cephalosporin hydroxylase
MSRFVGRPSLIFEIGCGRGGSLQLWKKYFGPDARIVGIDVRPECAQFEEPQISIRIGSQDDINFLSSMITEFGAPDIVLDDGSHFMSHIHETFQFLYPKTSATGVYIVEDLHTAYWQEYGGGLRVPGSFIEKAKLLIDELNQKHLPDEIPDTVFSRSTSSISFYDSMVVFERAPLVHHYHTMMPPQPPGSPGW